MTFSHPEIARRVEACRASDWSEPLDLTDLDAGDSDIDALCALSPERLQSIALGWGKGAFLIFNTKLTDAGVGRLASHCPNLQSLGVGGCKNLTDAAVRAVAERCPNLQSLDVGWCENLTDAAVRAVAERCPSLQSLDVSECGNLTDAAVRAVAERCPNLQSLDVSGCERLTDLRPLSAILPPAGRLTSLNAYECKGLGLPEEIAISGDARKILDYLRRGGKRPWLHVKGVLLGEPGCGKSWIRDRLMGRKPVGRVQTHDFEVETLKLDGVRGKKRPVRLRLFDFGGQAALHGSHRLFLASERNLFVIPINATLPLNPADRGGVGPAPQTNRLDYWLRLVRWTFRENRWVEWRGDADGRGETDGPVLAPVLVVVSWCDQLRGAGWTLDEKELREKYNLPNLHVLDDFSASKPARRGPRAGQTATGPADDIERLRGKLREMVGGMDYVFTAGYPKDFRDLRQWLASKDAGVPKYTGLNNFRAICKKVGCDSPRWQTQYLLMFNNLGLLLWRGADAAVRGDKTHPLYRHVFNPGWVRGPVYAIINDAFPRERPWLSRQEVYRFLADRRRNHSTCQPWRRWKFREEDAGLVMKLMTACELAVELEDSVLPGGGYLILDKLRVSDFVALPDESYGLRKRYTCEFLGEGALPRFIGRMHRQIAAEDRETYMFRNKVRVFLEDKPDVQARVHANIDTRQIEIGITGGTSAEQNTLLGQVLGELQRYVSLREGDAPPARNKGGRPPEDKTPQAREQARRIYEAWKGLGAAKNKASILAEGFNLGEAEVEEIYKRERKRQERKRQNQGT